MLTADEFVRGVVGRIAISVSLCADAGMAVATTLTIDDFSSGEFQGAEEYPYFWQRYQTTSTGTMLGGNRATTSTYNDGFKVADGVFHYSSALQYNERGQVNQYAHPMTGTTLLYGNDTSFGIPYLSADLRGYDSIDLTFASVADDFTLRFTARMFSGMNLGEAYYSIPVAVSAAPVRVSLPFAEFATFGVLNWADVASLQFRFYDGLTDGGNPLDFTLDGIEAVTADVAEPTSLGLLAVGLALVVIMRRTRKGGAAAG
jgi:hypothetical protein